MESSSFNYNYDDDKSDVRIKYSSIIHPNYKHVHYNFNFIRDIHHFDYLDHQPLRVNTEDVPTPYAKGLEMEYLPNKGKIIKAVKKSLGK